MKKKHTHRLHSGIAISVLGIAVCLLGEQLLGGVFSPALQGRISDTQLVRSGLDAIRKEYVDVDPLLLHSAQRLQKRVTVRSHVSVPIFTLETALMQRREFLKKTLSVVIAGTDGRDFGTYNASVGAHPYWLQATLDRDALHFQIDAAQVSDFFNALRGDVIPVPVDSTLSAVYEDHGVERVTADKPAEPGYVLNTASSAQLVIRSLHGTGGTLSVAAVSTPGRIINQTGRDLGTLQYLASGQSNFAGSGDGRISNVRKGLADFMDDILVAPGATFSFNAAVNNMSLSAGWEKALMIVNGRDLVPIAGGGICQVATTMYRAALNAGLQITERAAHSLFVTYYEKYGVGIDATILPHQQDLTFVNDTKGYILVQAYSKGFEAAVHLYGVPDGRTVTLQGPFFSTSAPSPADALLQRTLKNNEIAWVQTIRYADGTKRDELILSRYLAIPSRLRMQYASNPLQKNS